MNFHYPTALQASEYEGMAYITPRVKLEQRVIRPYAAEDYPGFFEDSTCTVTVLSARRTFWEKATALHAEAHRPMEAPTPQYFSRHYYDLAMLFDTEEGKQAATDFGLLAQVVTHKATFFRSSWARYDLARPGTLQLIPNATRIKDLRIDYWAMAPMMFDKNPPSFEDILARVENLERTING